MSRQIELTEKQLERSRQFALEAKLRQQQQQSEEENRWLHQEENNLVNYKLNAWWPKLIYD